MRTGIVNAIKSVFIAIAFLLGSAAFFVLIGFEIHYGMAGGKFGGADIATMPGTFWLFVGLQAAWGSSFVVDAIKEIWKLLDRPTEGGNQDSHLPLAYLVAMFWILATAALVLINLLAVWSAYEMIVNMYGLLSHLEMPKRAILGGFALVLFLVICYVCYMFLLRTLIDTVYPRARVATVRLIPWPRSGVP